MRFWSAACRGFFKLGFTLIAAVVAGCQPLSPDALDEERDPNFLTGRSRASTGDYKGAVAAYELALSSNPRSAAAHKALGLVYYQHLEDHAAAIYHFQKLLAINAKDPHAETIKQHVNACKQELASSAALGPINHAVQREIERLDADRRRLAADNSNLVAQVQFLRRQLAERVQAAQQSAQPFAQLGGAPLPPAGPGPSQPQGTPGNPSPSQTLRPPVGSGNAATNPPRASGTPLTGIELPGKKLLLPPAGAPSNSGAAAQARTNAATARSTRTHKVRLGETFHSIAKRYNTTTSGLSLINPSVNPLRIRAGQILNVPAGSN